jgi:hypothetical protein
MSNSGPGMPHVFLGTSRPIDIRIGRIEGEAIWGRLHESKYFDSDPSNDRMLLAGLVLGFTPAVVPGLTLGGTRVYQEYIPPGGLSLSAYIRDPYLHPLANPLVGGANQLASLFFRWVVPQGGFEAYGEWAREDTWDGTRDLLLEPEHSQGYMIGLQNVGALGRKWLRLYGELTHLEASGSFRSGRGVVTYYTNSGVIQGYTNQGQLLGASIGPGSNTWVLGGDVFHTLGSTGLQLQRIAHDNDAYYNIWAPAYGYTGHDVEYMLGARQRLLMRRMALDLSLSYSRRYNREFLDLSPTFQLPRMTDHNLHLIVGARWQPPLP